MTKHSPTDQPLPAGDLHADRRDYQQDELHRADLPNDPLVMFADWMQSARDRKLIDAAAMTLATATTSGLPSARIVLLKHYGEDGFYWYTGYQSRKGAELSENPHAALLFYWRELERQVRLEGQVEKLTPEQSNDYFNSRPDGSKYSAVVSPQSQVIPNQAWLAERQQKLAAKQSADQLQRPENWGGYRLIPTAIEFWQGRPSRSHDRFRYTLSDDRQWQIDRLAP